MESERIRVDGIGPKDAKIVIVGESLGETEEKNRLPFQGMAGKVLDGLLEEAGIKREECYITNLYKYRPPKNDIALVEKQELSRAKDELIEELLMLSPNVIVTLGEYATQAVTEKRGVTKYRGSVLETRYGKVIPSIHPSAISREWSFRPMAVVDFKRIKAESEYKDIKRQHRVLDINPTYSAVCEYLNRIIQDKLLVAFDIEVETRQINCISFAISPTYSMCIPFWFGASGSIWSEEQERTIWDLIRSVLEDTTIRKIAQNATYDMTVLRDLYGIRVQGLWLDTMLAFHAVYPELPKGLDLLTSVYTDVSYYKYQRTTKDMDEFFRYNAMDSAVTFECATKIYAEMEEVGITKFYYEHMHSLIAPLMDITSRGVLIDSEKKKGLKVLLTAKLEQLIQQFSDAVDVKAIGLTISPTSPAQIMFWLYKILKYPVQKKLRKDKGISTESVDEEILLKFSAEHPENIALKILLDIRETKKMLSTYVETKYDKEEDGSERARTSYLITGTETGRLSSKATVWNTGTNLQNIPKGPVRDIFIPDQGQVFINADLSQAEARVVAVLAGETRLIRVFGEGGDIHRKNAANIFRVPEASVTKEQRELAKRVIHASNYGMGPITFSKTAGIPVAEAKALLNKYFQEYPRIKLWHMSIEAQLKRSRTLITPLGRRRTFFNRWDGSMLKEAYAYIPQSTVADLLNMGLRRLYSMEGNTFRILLQIHDAVLVECDISSRDAVAKLLKTTLEIPITINRQTLIIPADIQVGMSWDRLEKFKC